MCLIVQSPSFQGLEAICSLNHTLFSLDNTNNSGSYNSALFPYAQMLNGVMLAFTDLCEGG